MPGTSGRYPGLSARSVIDLTDELDEVGIRRLAPELGGLASPIKLASATNLPPAIKLTPAIEFEPAQQVPMNEVNGSPKKNGSGQIVHQRSNTWLSTSFTQLSIELGTGPHGHKADLASEIDGGGSSSMHLSIPKASPCASVYLPPLTPFQQGATTSTAPPHKPKRVSTPTPSGDEESDSDECWSFETEFPKWPKHAEREGILQSLTRGEGSLQWQNYITSNPSALDPLQFIPLVLPHPLLIKVAQDCLPTRPIDTGYREQLECIREMAITLFKDCKLRTWGNKISKLRRCLRLLETSCVVRSSRCPPCAKRDIPCVQGAGRNCLFCNLHDPRPCTKEGAYWGLQAERKENRSSMAGKKQVKEAPVVLLSMDIDGPAEHRHPAPIDSTEPVPVDFIDLGTVQHLQPSVGLTISIPDPSIWTGPRSAPEAGISTRPASNHTNHTHESHSDSERDRGLDSWRRARSNVREYSFGRHPVTHHRPVTSPTAPPPKRKRVPPPKRKRVSHSPSPLPGDEKPVICHLFKSWPKGCESDDIFRGLMSHEAENAWNDYLAANFGDLDPHAILHLVLPHPLLRKALGAWWPTVLIETGYRGQVGLIRRKAISLFKDVSESTRKTNFWRLRRCLRLLTEPCVVRSPPCEPCWRQHELCVEGGDGDCQHCILHLNPRCQQEGGDGLAVLSKVACAKVKQSMEGRPTKKTSNPTSREVSSGEKVTVQKDLSPHDLRLDAGEQQAGAVPVGAGSGDLHKHMLLLSNEPRVPEGKSNELQVLKDFQSRAGTPVRGDFWVRENPGPRSSTHNNISTQDDTGLKATARPTPLPAPAPTRRQILNLERLLQGFKEHLSEDPNDSRKRHGEFILNALEDDLAGGTILGGSGPDLSDLRRHMVDREPDEERKERAGFLLKRLEGMALASTQ
ncbi:hypothetical protein Q8F55_004647 [Vanrija albida]|uniref:Zn(2)-C6 fungal-type domain-containing protein n=1 Tax=Vanrija albida TaxID=181172 RepID=A0ABR3Q7L3_9TREE